MTIAIITLVLFVISHSERLASPPKNEDKQPRNRYLTVGFLVPGAGTATSELLGLSPTVIGNEQVAVVLDKSSLQLVLGVLINVLLVVGDDGLGDSLTDGIDLRSVTTTGDTDTDIDTSELVGTDDQERLVDLEAEDLRLNQGERLAIDLDEALALLALGDSSSRLLLAEALNSRDGSHGGKYGPCRCRKGTDRKSVV